jgi:hypothetical protein
MKTNNSSVKKKDEVVYNELEIINEINKNHCINISNTITKTTFSENNFSTLKEKMEALLDSRLFDIPYITTIEVKQIISQLNTIESISLG